MMRLGWKARIMMVGGTLAALLFLLLGLREMERSSAATVPATSSGAMNPQAQAIVLAAAARPIRTGETITAAMIRNAATDPARHPSAATPAELIGKVATRAIAEGALIPRDAAENGEKLAIRVPVGMRAISIDTTAEIAVAGLVRPGDRVDVQVVYPGADAISGARGSGRSRAQTLLQMVQVLAVGDAVLGAQQTSGKDQLSAPPPPARTVTLALSPEQVSILSLAKSTGALTLSLRNPVDGVQVAIAPATSRGPDPALAVPAASVTVQAAPPVRARLSTPTRQPIELVVGDRRETIYSGSGQR